MTNVQVCVASAGTWLSNTAINIIDLCASWLTDAEEVLPRTGGAIGFDGCNIATNRHNLVKLALDKEATHVLFLDTDMLYPKDTIVRLIRHNKDIVGANGPKRCHPIQGTAVLFGGEQIKTNESDTGLQEVSGIGTGCLLINTEVFKNLELPWFEHRWVPEKQKYIGSDIYFSIMARRAGYKVFVDHDISKEIAHIGNYPYMFKEEYKNANE